MAIQTEVLPSFYQDSVVLMRVAGEIRGRAGVREAAAFMGTSANHELLERSGLATAASQTARPDDLILVVDADDDTGARAAIAEARRLLTERRRATDDAGTLRPRTLDAALRVLPGANVVAISVPGSYATFEARRALRRGLHVFLFSDNVPLADEIQLKREAVSRGLLCMGPDCGTAYLNGVGLGFANAVTRGRMGCVAASGTGLQAVASRLAALGEGVSQGIGVGGRDLSKDVGGAMTLFALEALACDPLTEAIVLISKPPHPDVLARLQTAIEKARKPVVVCCLGAAAGAGPAVWVRTLDQAADAVVARLRGIAWSPRPFQDPDAVRSRLSVLGARTLGKTVLGLYTGGTLAHEAHLLLDELTGAERAHRILDLGDDQYTVGRPHPMIDPQPRTELLVQAGRDAGVGVVLADLVLGTGSHANPAEPLASAFEQARAVAQAAGRPLMGVVSVVGTAQDRQGLARQAARLEAAGMTVLPSNAEAARFAALLVQPDLDARLLGTNR